jgi:hypothetical protein
MNLYNLIHIPRFLHTSSELLLLLLLLLVITFIQSIYTHIP